MFTRRSLLSLTDDEVETHPKMAAAAAATNRDNKTAEKILVDRQKRLGVASST